jgi:hypothetical protein
MKVHTLARVQLIPASLDEVFEFFEKPENLAHITPHWLGFRILTPLPIDMKVGTVIDYIVRWLGMQVRWRTLITSYQPRVKFVDEQIMGPYSLWHHTHAFVGRDRATEMTDSVRYVLPGGFLGEAVHALLVRRQIEKIFEYRGKMIQTMFAHETRRSSVNISVLLP